MLVRKSHFYKKPQRGTSRAEILLWQHILTTFPRPESSPLCCKTGVANYSPQPILLEYTTLTHLGIIYGCIITMIDLSSCDRDHMVHKGENVYFLDPVLRDEIHSLNRYLFIYLRRPQEISQ